MGAEITVDQAVVAQVEEAHVGRAQDVEVVDEVEAPEKIEATPEVVAALLPTTSGGIFNWPLLL